MSDPQEERSMKQQQHETLPKNQPLPVETIPLQHRLSKLTDTKLTSGSLGNINIARSSLDIYSK